MLPPGVNGTLKNAPNQSYLKKKKKKKADVRILQIKLDKTLCGSTFEEFYLSYNILTENSTYVAVSLFLYESNEFENQDPSDASF